VPTPRCGNGSVVSNGELDLLWDQHHMSRACVRRGEEAWLSVDKDSKTLLPVLYINLDQDKDRRAHILETLAQDEDNLRLMRVAALEPPIALPGAAFADTLSVGEIGCYASHMKAWRGRHSTLSSCATRACRAVASPTSSAVRARASCADGSCARGRWIQTSAAPGTSISIATAFGPR